MPRVRKTRRLPGAVRFALVFAACFLSGIGIVLIPAVHDGVTRLSGLLVSISHHAIQLCGGSSWQAGPVLRDPASGFAIEMKDGCNGVNVTLLLWAAVLAFPAGWKAKAVGLTLGGAVIQGLNLLRFISLFYLGQYSKAWFDFAHGYLWESLLVLDTMIFFWIWVSRVSRLKVAPDEAG